MWVEACSDGQYDEAYDGCKFKYQERDFEAGGFVGEDHFVGARWHQSSEVKGEDGKGWGRFAVNRRTPVGMEGLF